MSTNKFQLATTLYKDVADGQGFVLQDGKPCLLEGLKGAMMPALVIGVQHDVPLWTWSVCQTVQQICEEVLFPVWQQKEIADTLRKDCCVLVLRFT